MEKRIALIVKFIVSLFANLNGTSFVGIKGYTSSTSGEVANHVVIANASYGNAVEEDLKKLRNATDDDVKAINEKSGFSFEMIKLAIQKLTDSFVKNQSVETQSAQSKGQQDAYINITPSIKWHIESGKVHIFAQAHSKEVLVAGTYKDVNSRELTLCQNAVKKYFDFRTAKFRNFIVEKDQLSGVNIDGQKITLKG
jgi:hypothetical protein